MVSRALSFPPLHLVIAALALAASGSAGCQFDPSGQVGADGAVPEPDARRPPDAAIGDARVPDAREPDARVPDAAVPPDAAPLPSEDVLVDRGLLTRYFIDESNSGSDVDTLEDSAPDPLNLTIDDAGGAVVFIEESENRGLRWNALTDQGRAAAPLAPNSKIRQALNGSTRATIEVVVDIDQFADGGRISHIGEGNDRGELTLRLEQPQSVRFLLNNDEQQQVDWPLTLIGRERTVLHLVLDTSQAAPADRVRLYADGVLQPNPGLAAPDQNEAINILSTNTFYVLGNKTSGGSSIAGTIFYAAMYSTALDPAEVDHNADILRDDDDTPDN